MILSLVSILAVSCATPTPQVIVQTQVVEKPVIQTQVVEKPVVQTQVVEKQVEVTPTPTNLEKPVELVQWVFPRYSNVVGYADRTPNYGDYEKILAQQFQELHPNVSIRVETIPWDNGPAKIDAAIAAGNPPDVLQDGFVRTPIWWAEGALEPMDNALDPADKADFLQSYLDIYTIDGHLHGLPSSSWVAFMVANKTLVDAAGVGDMLPPANKPAWSIDTFMQVCRAVNKPPDHYCFGFYAGDPQGADYENLPWFWGFGAKYLNATRDQLIINSPEGVKALQTLVDMQNEGLMIPGAAGLKGVDLQSLFVQKKVVFMGWDNSAWTAVANGIKDGVTQPPLDVTGMSFPSVDGKIVPFAAGNVGYVVFKQTDPNKRYWAIEYAKFLDNSQHQTEMSTNLGQFPARKSVGDIFKGRADLQTGTALVAQATQGDYGAGLKKVGQIRTLWAVALQEALTGKKTPQQALDDFVAAGNPLLK